MRRTTPKAKVATDFQELDASNLVTFAGGTVTGMTGSITLSDPTVPLLQITAEATALDVTNKKIVAGDRSKTTKNLQHQQANKLMTSLTTNAHYVEDTADTLAAGDLEKAEQIINSSGYKLKKRGTPHARAFELVDSGEGWAHFRTSKPTAKKTSNILWRYGTTDQKGTVPEKLVTQYTNTLDMVITDIPSGTILAIQFASGELSGIVRKNNHPTFSFSVNDPYDWSDFIYVVIP